MKKSSGRPAVCVCRFQVPDTFGASTRSIRSRSRLIEQGIFQDHRRVQHAAERRQVAVDRGQHRGDVGFLRHIGGVDDDPGAELLQLGDRLAGLGRVGASAPHQDEGAGAALGHPAGDRQPEAAQPARDQVAGVGAERHGLILGGDRRDRLVAERQHDLADVLAVLHEAEGVDCRR